MIDSHCHLAGAEFAADLPEVIERATSAGVSTVLCILSDDDQEEDLGAARLQSLWRATRFAVGIHPHKAGVHAGKVAGGVEAVANRANRYGAAAIGEIGLDYHYDFSPRDVQQEVFRAQIALARRLSLPIIIHTREATDDTLRLVRDEGGGEVQGVFHCFTGDPTMARAALDLGFYLSFAGLVTFPRADAIRDSARLTPPDRLLVETDSPYLAPVPHRGQRNEPAFVAQVLARLAEVRNAPVDDLAATTTRNFSALFGSAVS